MKEGVSETARWSSVVTAVNPMNRPGEGGLFPLVIPSMLLTIFLFSIMRMRSCRRLGAMPHKR